MKKHQASVFIGFIALFFSNFSFSFPVEELTRLENSTLVQTGEKFITLLGKQPKLGEQVANFKAVDGNFAQVELSDFADKNVLISVVPSIDTGVCSVQTKRFNDAVSKLEQDTVILTISNDLPFAQRRFCTLEKVDNLTLLSDVVWHDFAYAYGVMVKDMGLLTRAIFVINKQQQLVYQEFVANITDEPDYDAALKALTTIKEPTSTLEQATAPAETTSN